MAHMISMVTALQLVEYGLVERIDEVRAGKISIIFGKSDATELVVGKVNGGAVLGEVFVLCNLAETLISEMLLTDKGIVIVKNNTTVAGICGGQVVFRGSRVPVARPGSSDRFWNIGLEQLIRTTLGSLYPVDPLVAELSMALASCLDKVAEESVGGQLRLDDADATTNLLCGSARPTFSQDQVRRARAMQRGCNNVSARTLGATVEALAWTDMPVGLPKSLFDKIADRRDNIPYLLTHERQLHLGGSGVRSEIPGEVAHLDIIGKYKADKGTGATFVLIIIDEATAYEVAYAIKGKDNSKDAVKLYQTFLLSWGRCLAKLRSDAASEVTRQFLEDLNRRLEAPLEILDAFPRDESGRDQEGVRIDKAPPEAFGKFFERHWQTLKRDIANNQLCQENLRSEDFWHWCVIDTVDRRNGLLCELHPSMTPLQRMTGCKPVADQMTRHRYGALGVTPKVGKQGGPPEPGFELVCVVGSPQLTPGVWMVLLENSYVPVPRGDVRPVLEHTIERTAAQWHELQPEFSSSGQLIRIHSGVDKNFTLSLVLRKYQGRQLSQSASVELTDAQRGSLELYKGRVVAGGGITAKSNRQLAGRVMRSDTGSVPMSEAAVRKAVASPSMRTTQSPDNVHLVTIPALECMPTNTYDAVGSMEEQTIATAGARISPPR